MGINTVLNNARKECDNEREAQVLANDIYVKEKRLAKMLWITAGWDPNWGNALMDLVGEEVYNKIAEMAKEDK